MSKHLILAGGGHAHLHILKQLQTERLPDTTITLISPDPYQYYSGMFSGFVEGLYRLDEIRLELPRLARRANVKWLEDSVVRVDPKQQILYTKKGVQLPFDWLSLNVGSRTAHVDVPGVRSLATLIKPNFLLPQRIQILQSAPSVAVIGGGPAGVEMALALQARRVQQGQNSGVQLLTSGQLLSAQTDEGQRRRLRSRLAESGIQLTEGATVERLMLQSDDLRLIECADGRSLSAAQVLWLTGPAAPPFLRESGLLVDRQGFALTRLTLQSWEHDHIFAVGDCRTLAAYPELDKAGVYAVREARVLWHNLRALTANQGKQSSARAAAPKLREYRPQSSYLSILNAGRKTAILFFRGMMFSGRWCWQLKHFLDEQFMKNYR